jgi:hypothetical protein
VGNVVVVVQFLGGGEIRTVSTHGADIMRGGVLEMLLLGEFRPENLLASVTPLVARGASAVCEDSLLRVKLSVTDLTIVISIAVK